MDSFWFWGLSGLVGILSVFSIALSNNVATFPLVEMLNDVIIPVWVINNDPALIFQHKEKENKGRHGHHFVAVSVSNSTSCDVCSKSMANKSALRCESKTTLISLSPLTCWKFIFSGSWWICTNMKNIEINIYCQSTESYISLCNSSYIV